MKAFLLSLILMAGITIVSAFALQAIDMSSKTENSTQSGNVRL